MEWVGAKGFPKPSLFPINGKLQLFTFFMYSEVSYCNTSTLL